MTPSIIATIATCLTTIIGGVYAVIAAVKKNKAAKIAANIQSISAQIKLASTDAERKDLQDALNKLVNS